MNYFYDVIINMNEDNIFSFYEWENYDSIELVKKIPLFRVSTNTLKDFYVWNIKVSVDFLNEIVDKTILKNNKINKTIKYACLLCDTKNTLVVEFDNDGNVISRSNLLLDDDANVLEFIYSYKVSKIEYEKINFLAVNQLLRKEEQIKKVLKIEFNTIIKNNDLSKLKYLFNEWFGYEEKSVVKITNKIHEELNKEVTLKTKSIYELVVLSYSKS